MEPEQAVVALNKLIVSGYRLKDKLVAEYNSLPKREKPGGHEAVVPSETRALWAQQIIDWTNHTLQRLQDVYISVAEAYQFREVQTLSVSNSEFDDRFYNQLNTLQARLEVLRDYKDFIFQHTNIQIVAGRDANVQIGGTQNTQEVTNEG